MEPVYYGVWLQDTVMEIEPVFDANLDITWQHHKWMEKRSQHPAIRHLSPKQEELSSNTIGKIGKQHEPIETPARNCVTVSSTEKISGLRNLIPGNQSGLQKKELRQPGYRFTVGIPPALVQHNPSVHCLFYSLNLFIGWNEGRLANKKLSIYSSPRHIAKSPVSGCPLCFYVLSICVTK